MHQLPVELVDDAATVRLGLRDRVGMRSQRLALGRCTRQDSAWSGYPPVAAISAGSNSKDNGSIAAKSRPLRRRDLLLPAERSEKMR